MSGKNKEALKADREANLNLYSEYNKTLRAWFVAFGIAVPAIFITSKDANVFLHNSYYIKFIIAWFLAGVFFQILISFLNKYISWSAYHRDDCTLNEKNCSPKHKYFAFHENKIWIDIMLDIVTFFCFAIAIITLFLTVRSCE